MSEIYEDYLDSHGGSPVTSPDRARTYARLNPAPWSGSAPNSQYSPSSYGGSMRKKTTRRGNPHTSNRVQSTYEFEEEGYGSGEYDDAIEFNLIRVKVVVFSLYLVDDSLIFDFFWLASLPR